mgnify:CR=1 FL=1
MKMSLRVWCGVCAALVGTGAMAETAPGLPVTRLVVQARTGVPDLLCSPAPAKPATSAQADPDPQEPPDAQEVEAQLSVLPAEREAPPAGAAQGAWPQARPGQPLRVAIWGDSHLAAGFFTSELVRLLPEVNPAAAVLIAAVFGGIRRLPKTAMPFGPKAQPDDVARLPYGLCDSRRTSRLGPTRYGDDDGAGIMCRRLPL